MKEKQIFIQMIGSLSGYRVSGLAYQMNPKEVYKVGKKEGLNLIKHGEARLATEDQIKLHE